ncbi:MAG TPA: regulatory protein RecX [Cryomorphaceae bacterium]|nr:regulatory protein RecX [Cryomorphaceae bacterium]
MYPKKYTPSQNKEYITRWCAKSERAPLEVKRKLQSRGMSAQDAEAVVVELEETGFVDADRFAVAYTRDKYRFNKWGERKIHASLSALGIDEGIIVRALEEIDRETYIENLRGLYAAKMRRVKTPDDREARMKCFGYLLGRGYTADDIRRVEEEWKR